MTPYIYDDRASFEDITKRIEEAYNLDKSELKAKGLKGREWCLSDEAGFTAEHQGKRVIKHIDKLLSTWTPRKHYELINTNQVKEDVLPHKLLY